MEQRVDTLAQHGRSLAELTTTISMARLKKLNLNFRDPKSTLSQSNTAGPPRKVTLCSKRPWEVWQQREPPRSACRRAGGEGSSKHSAASDDDLHSLKVLRRAGDSLIARVGKSPPQVSPFKPKRPSREARLSAETTVSETPSQLEITTLK